jgi:TrmH family RNA methyltransferase
MTKSWKDNVSFILVEPTEPGNIGAAARSLKNMGFRRLELVNPVPYLTGEARSMACQAKDILGRATVYRRFPEAIADKSLIVGTTRRLGSRRGTIFPVKDGARKIARAAQNNTVAILFGNEHNGLTNREIDECGFLITVPADPASPSLNLAQSVMLVAYELSQQREDQSSTRSAALPKFVPTGEIQRLHRRIQATLRLLDYKPKGSKDLEMDIRRNLKRLIGRAGLTEWELNMLYGLCRQVEKKLNREKMS